MSDRMDTRPAYLELRARVLAWSIGRRLAYGYVAASILLLAIVGLQAPSAEAWFWRAVAILLFLVMSLRSALIWAHRRKPSKLSWWLRPTHTERESPRGWLVYAVLFGVSPLFILLL